MENRLFIVHVILTETQLKHLQQILWLLYKAVVDNALETSSAETCDKSEELGEKNSCGFKSIPILNVSKGKYFKNDTRQEKTPSDTETDGCTVPVAMKQWLWQDKKGEWILFPKETNEKINMSYKRDQKSTVVAFIGDQA